eukprot:TRINITY_DN62862_c0_g1_i1.p1 TRINITY_DN62862_c0_g1~~TRINITY_DN62862_c0_g1_i1.p1  ORF type:complete len:390 (+),score=66.10 TRINITY_DN62862_c0_g1_i1:78-1247(+)
MPVLSSSGERVRVVLVGCGNIAYKHLQAMSAGKPCRFEVTALCDPNHSNRAKVLQRCQELSLGESIQIFPSLDEAIVADPDGSVFDTVAIFVPSLGTLHEEMAVKAMHAKRHVILEKPVALSLDSARRILNARNSYIRDKVFMVAENSAYWPEVVAAKKAIDDGCIGSVISARVKYWESASHALNEWAVNYESSDSYYNRGEAGIVFDAGFHWIRPLRMMIGDIESVVATAGKSFEKMNGASMVHALLRNAQGLTSTFEGILVPSAISNQPFFVIQGSKGEIVIDGWPNAAPCKLHTEGADGLVTTELSNRGWDEGYTGELADFAAAVLDGKELESGPEQALADLATILTMFKSAHTGRWERVDELEESVTPGQLNGWRRAGTKRKEPE